MPAVTPKPLAGISNVIATVVNDVLNPFAGNGPTTPVDPPTTWTLLAFVRRELSGASVSVAPTGPITVTPTLTFTDGIVYGNANAVDASGLPLAYTIVSEPTLGGKITFFPAVDNQAPGAFTYLPYSTVLTGATEQFSELVSETTPFDTALENIPGLGSLVSPILTSLYQVPVLNTLLAPVIGYSVLVPFSSASVGELTSGVPAAFTYNVTSFDGTPISVNFYPASGLAKGQTAPTIMDGPGLASPGNTDPLSEWTITDLVPGIQPLRDGAATGGVNYNVVTWDPRGEFASGGTLQLDSPTYEGRDVSAIIDWIAQQPEALLDATNDPRLGMVGGSYGGGIQLVSAAIDPRIDAIVPAISWNSLNSSLYPNNAFKTSYASLLLLDLVETGARINPQLYSGILTGDLLGILSPSDQALLASSGPGVLVNNITAPTLFIQGTVDVLFPLQQAITNAQLLSGSVPDAMVWFCGGHGTCLNPGGDDGATILADTLAWLNTYVAKTQAAPGIPKFEWQDQNGQNYTSTVLPSDPAFYGKSITASGPGGTLPIIPIVGGSGPQSLVPLPYSLGDGAEASTALNLTVTPPAGTEIVGAPTLSFTYSGIGTSRDVYAQIVDTKTGLVLGNLVTPIPVTLDGNTYNVAVPLNDIAYTATGDPLTLQIVGSATPFENLTSFGVINVSNVALTLPTAANAMAA